MANPEHLEVLKQGVDAWNRWYMKNPEVQPDLSRADLSGADLGGVNLSRANLSRANLCEAKLRWANLSGANFSEAKLRWANLSRANLQGAIGLTQRQIDSAEGDTSTKLPKGIQHPVSWKKKPT